MDKKELQSIKILLWNIALTPSPPPHISTRNAKYRAERIINYIDNFDIIVLNECFLYRNIIMKIKISHPYIFTDKKVCYKVFNSGVVIISKIPISNVRFHHYSKGATWDWFVSKALIGITFNYNNKFYDLYGTHLQAGDKLSHHKARESQAKEIVQFIKLTHDLNNDLIVCGDFNCGPIIPKNGKEYSIHYSSRQDAEQRQKQYNIIEKELELKRIVIDPTDDDICAFLFKGTSNIQRIYLPDPVDENGINLSDTAVFCVELKK